MNGRMLSRFPLVLLVLIWTAGTVCAATNPALVSLGQLTAGIKAPTRIDVSAAGTLYVSDPRKNAILRFDQYGKALPALKGDYRISGSGLAVTPDGSRVYVSVVTAVAASGARSVKGVAVLDGTSGALLGYLGKGVDEFQEAGEIDLDAEGVVYVADTLARTVRVYDPLSRQLLYSFGGPGTTNGLFLSIRSLSVDAANGEVYVVDPSANGGIVRVQVFGLGGIFKRVIAQAAFGLFPPFAPNPNPLPPHNIGYPSGIAFDDAGRGYVADFQSDLCSFASGSSFVLLAKPAVAAGTGVGQLSGPVDIAYDSGTKRLFVANGARIEVFGVDGGSSPIFVNAAPGKPAALSPVSNSRVAVAFPLLQWQAATDANGDALTYEVKLQQGDAIIQAMSNLSATSVAAAPLEENKQYSWTVQASDGTDVSGFTAPESFWVDAVQESPTVPALSAPLAAASLNGQSTFGWSASSDPDPFESETISYRFQIAASEDFSTPLIQVDQANTQSAALATLAGYAGLKDGSVYNWRVIAIDEDGLFINSAVRTFTYDTNVLRVDANFPGAKVYLGGSHAYSGQYLGETPLELSDLPVGSTTLVVELAGFEPSVTPLTLAERDNADIKVVLIPAILPTGLKVSPLNAGAGKLQGTSELTPLAIDYDRDGRIDLLTAAASGQLTFYRRLEGQLEFAAGVKLALGLPVGSAPVAVDWNNDNSRDLLVGNADGSVQLYLNFNAPQSLQANGAALNAGTGAVPCVVDFDNDGKKDLVVGSGNGSVTLYLNTGSDADPVFGAGSALVPAAPANAAPFVSDWNADGYKDLLVASGEQIFLSLRLTDGTFADPVVVNVEGRLGDKLRLYALDLDGKRGKDLVVGNAAGQLSLATSFGKDNVSAYDEALLAKLKQIEALADQVNVTLDLSVIQVELKAKRNGQVKTMISQLLRTVSDPKLITALADLAGVL